MTGYAWLKSNEILVSQDDAGTGEERFSRVELAGDGSRLAAARTTAIALPAFAYRLLPSPNGAWILAAKDNGSRYTWIATNLATHRQAEWSSSGIYTAAWMPDSRGWIETIDQSSQTDIRYHAVSGAPAPDAGVAHLQDGETFNVPGDWDAVAVTPSYRVLLKASTLARSAAGVDLREYDLQASTWVGRSLRIVGMPGSRMVDTVLSRDATRMAWLLYTPDLARHQHYTDMGHPELGWRGHYRAELWDRTLQGGHRRRLCSIPLAGFSMATYAADPVSQWQLWPNTLRWSPDGRYLSFLWQDKIQSVPVLR